MLVPYHRHHDTIPGSISAELGDWKQTKKWELTVKLRLGHLIWSVCEGWESRPAESGQDRKARKCQNDLHVTGCALCHGHCPVDGRARRCRAPGARRFGVRSGCARRELGWPFRFLS